MNQIQIHVITYPAQMCSLLKLITLFPRPHAIEGVTLSSCTTENRSKVPLIIYVRMILASFDLPYVRVRKIFQTPPPYSCVRFHFVFQHDKILLEKYQLNYIRLYV